MPPRPAPLAPDVATALASDHGTAAVGWSPSGAAAETLVAPPLMPFARGVEAKGRERVR